MCFCVCIYITYMFYGFPPPKCGCMRGTFRSAAAWVVGTTCICAFVTFKRRYDGYVWNTEISTQRSLSETQPKIFRFIQSRCVYWMPPSPLPLSTPSIIHQFYVMYIVCVCVLLTRLFLSSSQMILTSAC